MHTIEAKPQAGDRHSRQWQDAVALAQVAVAEMLVRRIGTGRFDGTTYRRWLAMESLACRIGALSLDAVSEWHGAHSALRTTSMAWAMDLRDLAQASACDMRALGGDIHPPPDELACWHAFVAATAGSQRAGEALGAVLLHSRLADGPVRAVMATLAEMPFARPHAGRYLELRLGAGSPADRAQLLDAYSASALSVGAQRVATLYCSALATIVGAPARPG